MKIDRPIFILGPGRSGSTLLNDLLTFHRDVGYFINWTVKYPQMSYLAFGEALRSEWLERKVGRLRYWPRPIENYSVWKHCFPGFFKVRLDPCSNATGKERLAQLIRIHLALQRKSRFIAKLTGPAIFEFLQPIFPDARFVWINRDPRAVCYSYYRLGWIGVKRHHRDGLSETEQLERAINRYLGIMTRLSNE